MIGHDGTAGPSGVTAIAADGTAIDLGDPIRLFDDEDGMRVWQVVVPAGVELRRPLEVHVDVLPGRTRLNLVWL